MEIGPNVSGQVSIEDFFVLLCCFLHLGGRGVAGGGVGRMQGF